MAQVSAPAVPDNGLSIVGPVGTPPHASTDGANESVNLANGALTAYIPLLSLPQRGGWSLPIGYVHKSNSMHFMQQTTPSSTIYTGQGIPILVTDLAYYQAVQSNDDVLEPNLPRLQASEEYVGDYFHMNGSVAQYFNVFCITNWAFTDWSGNKHGFSNVSSCNYYLGAGNTHEIQVTESADGSFYRLDTTNPADVQVTAKDGTVYHFTGISPTFPVQDGSYSGNTDENAVSSRNFRMVDVNQNTVAVSTTVSGSSLIYTLTDTLQRQVSIGPGGVSYTDSNGTRQTIVRSPLTPGPQGNTLTYPNLGCYFSGQFQQSPYHNPTVSSQASVTNSNTEQISLTFPPVGSGGTSKVFQLRFDAASHLVQISYPTGGYTRYIYKDYTGGTLAMGNVACTQSDNLQVQYKCQNAANTGPSSGACSGSETQTQYVPNSVSPLMIAGLNSAYFNSSISVIDPVGRSTRHNFAVQAVSSVSPVETDVLFSDSAGHLVRTIHTDYTTTAPFTELSYPQTVTTTLNDASPVKSSVVKYQYNDTFAATFSSAGTQTLSLDNPTQIDEYDYDGSLKKTTTESWAASGYLSSSTHILDHPLLKAVSEQVSGLQSAIAYTYDNGSKTLGNITSLAATATNATTATTGYVRDSYGRTTQVTDPKGYKTTLGYDGATDSSCATTGSPFPTRVTNAKTQNTGYKYYACTGTVASVTDANNNVTGFTYDGIQRLVQAAYPDGGLDKISYVDSGQNSITDSRLQSGSTYETKATLLDGLGRTSETQVVLSTGSILTDVTYDVAGNVATVSNPYISASEPSAGITTNSYLNGNGGYDPLDRVWTVTRPDNSTARTVYTGNVADVYDETNRHWQRTSDAFGRLIQVKEPDPTSGVLTLETDYAYDGFGDLHQVDQWGGASGSPGDRQRIFSYDGFSRLKTANNGETGVITYGYDVDGNLISRNDARNITTSYWYDQLNRLTSKTYGVPSPTPLGYSSTPWPTYLYDSVTIAYGGSPNPPDTSANGIGHVVEAYTTVGASRKVTDLVHIAYDKVGRPNTDGWCVGECRNAGNIPSFESDTDYDMAGNVADNYSYAQPTASCIADSGVLSMFERWYTNDAAGRVQTVSSDIRSYPAQCSTPSTLSAPANLFSATSYGAFGLKSANLAADATWQNPTMTRTRTYDNRGRTATEVDQNSTSQNIYNYSLAGGYATNGNLTGFTDSVMGQWGFGYDQLNRLKTANITSSTYGGGSLAGAGMTWAYDVFGNRSAQTATTGLLPTPWESAASSNNRISSTNNGNVTYDAAGNIIDDGINRYKYDAENRVCAVYFYHSPTQMTAYIYDADGKRIAKGSIATFSCDQTTNGLVLSRLYIVGSKGEQLDEWDGTGSNRIHSNAYAGGTLLATFSGSTYSYAFNDWLGTKRAQISADGNLANLSTFSSLPFGDGLIKAGPDASEQHFTGKERDAESGLDYFGARYYASSMGRMMSPDWSAKAEPVPYAKLDNPQSLNLYEYVGNNPLSRADADGHDWRDTTKKLFQTAKASFYLKVESGVGLEVHGKGLLAKAQIGVKSVQETNAKFNNKGTVKKIDEASAKVKLGPVSIGPSITKEQTIQTGNGPRNYDAPSEVHGNFLYEVGESGKGSNWEVGVGIGAYVGVGGGLEVGFDAKELYQGVKEAFSSEPKPEEKKP